MSGQTANQNISELASSMGLKQNPLKLTDDQLKSIKEKTVAAMEADMSVWCDMFQRDVIKVDDWSRMMETCRLKYQKEFNKKVGEKVCPEE